MISSCEHELLSTLAFFDVFDHPLTRYELASWGDGGEPVAFPVFCAAVDALKERGVVAEQDGFIFLADRLDLPRQRRARQEWIARKMKRASLAARLLRHVPFVEMVAVCNRLSVGHPHEESDIDVFVVIRDGRLWLGRLLVTAVLQLAGLRRHGDRVANRICLSFYLTPRAAALDAVKLDDDPYLRYWIAHLLPLFARAAALCNFWRANEWAHRTLYQAPQPLPLIPGRASAFGTMLAWLLGGWLGDVFERTSRVWQVRHMGVRFAQENSAVVISNTMLKFHEQDRRAWYAAVWRERLTEIA